MFSEQVHTIVTGATGYLGAEIARRRGGVVPGRFELRCGAPFAGVDPNSITEIFHCAAVTRFSVDAETASAVNVAGSRAVFEFARRCPRLERIAHLSTLYVSGLDRGLVPAAVVEKPSAFANEYERSKWQAEAILVDEFDDLPWQIHRVATVIADDASGAVGQRNVVHNTLRLLRHGLLPVIPGDPQVPVYLVTADQAVDFIVEARDVRSVFNIAPTPAAAPSLDELVEVVWSQRAKAARFKPPYCGLDAFRELASGAERTGILGQAMSSVLPFAPQLYVAKAPESCLPETARLSDVVRSVMDRL